MARRCRLACTTRSRLEAPYRGQTDIGKKKMIELLGFYEDAAVLVPTQLSITEASFSPESMSPKANVKTKLILKKDSTAILGPSPSLGPL